jgi:hypothetical protein
MTIENIKQTDLVASEREMLAADRERWHRMGKGAHLDDWLAYGPGLLILRRLAMRIAYTNRPEGKAYTAAYGELLRSEGYDTKDKSAMTALTAVVWLHDDPERITILREIRDAMSPGDRARLGSPITARQRVEQIIKARTRGTEATVKQSPVAMLRQEIAELRRRNADLEKRDGSLCDFKLSTAHEIGWIMARHMGESKFREVYKEGLAHYKKTKKEAPAG